MDYTAPVVEVIGPASELVQDFMGPTCDGDGYSLSFGWVITPLEEEKAE